MTAPGPVAPIGNAADPLGGIFKAINSGFNSWMGLQQQALNMRQQAITAAQAKNKGGAGAGTAAGGFDTTTIIEIVAVVGLAGLLIYAVTKSSRKSAS